MRKEDQLNSTLSSRRELSFIDGFLSDHPEAGLYLVGGAVRDALLARHPREVDFDFVVTGLPAPELEAWFRTRGVLNLVGQHFGVYKFMPTGHSPEDIEFIDIALPRTEAVARGSLGGYKDFDVQSDPHLPIQDDLARRDFTINAMAFDVRERKLIDPFDGQANLAQKLLRAVGSPSERFTEDLSRILRGVRFASELGFAIEEETSRAIRELISNVNRQTEVEGSLVYVVPRETVGSELAKALSRQPARAVEIFSAHNVWRECFPHVHEQLEREPDYLVPLSRTAPGELTVVVVLLLRGLSMEDARDTLSFTGLSTLERGSSHRIETSLVMTLVRLLQEEPRPQDIEEMRASTFEKHFLNDKGPLFLRCLELTGADDLRRAIHARRTQIENRWLVDHDESIAPLISGQDVLAHGVVAGPEVRIWLDRVRDLQLDGKLMRREDALAWLEQQLKQKSSS
ncbi:CCA tRNA nucleotidyltransferase [Candidatus Uhrbacteria bacterium]|nr:CCA tRNA nucleotidyltransferase [Candidatus Uhrbacteria bacterium]